MQLLYTADAHAKNGRNGEVETKDKMLKLKLSLPKSLGGAGTEGAVNPEQLFACGYAACFGSALEHAAKEMQEKLEAVHVFSSVGIGKNTAGGFALSVELKIYLPNLSLEKTQALAEAAHRICPYSNAIRNNVDVTITAIDHAIF